MTLSGPWAQAAAVLGLSIRAVGPHWHISGVIDDVKLTIESQVRGQYAGAWIVATAFFPPLGVGLRLRTANALDKLEHLVGFLDLEIGDARFDDAYEIKAKDPERTRALLTPEVRAAIVALGPNDLTIGDAGVEFATSWMHGNVDQIVGVARGVAHLVRTLCEAAAHTG